MNTVFEYSYNVNSIRINKDKLNIMINENLISLTDDIDKSLTTW